MYRFSGFGAYSPPPASIDAALSSASASSGVPLPILRAVAYQESRYDPAAVSPKGAQGLLQIMPATGASLGLQDPFNPSQNATAGASYLKSLYDQYGDWRTALIAYNEGPGNYAKSGAFSSSASYADSILGNAGPLDSSPLQVADSSLPIDPGMSPGPVLDMASDSPLVLVGLGLGVLGLVAWLS